MQLLELSQIIFNLTASLAFVTIIVAAVMVVHGASAIIEAVKKFVSPLLFIANMFKKK